MTEHTVPLGYLVGTGEPVAVPVRHLAVTGQTQMSGKTTTLEALVSRSRLTAIAFITKRAEQSFTTGRVLAPYFRERADWQFVSAVLEATLREKLKFERAWIMRACKGAKTLKDVQRNVHAAMITAKGLASDVYLTLDHYLDIVIPQIARLPHVSGAGLVVHPGLNVMDLSGYSTELQGLVIRSTLEFVYTHCDDTLVIIPEAWEFIPQNRGSPVLLAAEELIRKGGAAKNFVWLDSQDIAGVHKNVLRQVGVWILGVQREANEVKRALAHIPGWLRKPKVDDVMELERGQFFVCYDKTVAKVYVQPAWMNERPAREIAVGQRSVKHAVAPLPKPRETQVDEKHAAALRADNERLTTENVMLRNRIARLETDIAELKSPRRQRTEGHQPEPGPRPAPPTGGSGVRRDPMKVALSDGLSDFEDLYQRIKLRALDDPGLLWLLQSKPELEVTVERRRIEASDATLYGRLACLIADGFFDETRAGNAAFEELKRRGWSTAKPNVYRELDKLAGHGFVTKEANGYQAVKGMKVNIVEREAA